MKDWLKWLIIFIAAGLLIYGVLAYFRTIQQTSNSFLKTSPAPTITITPSPSQTPPSTLNPSSEQSVEGRKCGSATGYYCESGYECAPDPAITGFVGDAPGICVKE